MFRFRLDVLPKAQRALWAELGDTPQSFVLYGGTAIALRLGHRQSIDYDFFSNETFEPDRLLLSLKYLKGARVEQRGDNTLSTVVDRDGMVKISFFGDVRMNHVYEPDLASENSLQVASLLDLVATKLKTVQQRAEMKDYTDIGVALEHGITLAKALAAAKAIYGETFDAMASLKALTYFEDGNLPSLSVNMRTQLLRAVESVNVEELPGLQGNPGIRRRDKV